ncbi:MAG TPA: twin-arginine translocase TatA/TatE family subunit [Anaerolineaceae bacterium]
MSLPGGWEWIIILVIVLLLFGVGRISKISGELGNSIRAFREGISGKKDDQPKSEKPAETKTESKDESK